MVEHLCCVCAEQSLQTIGGKNTVRVVLKRDTETMLRGVHRRVETPAFSTGGNGNPGQQRCGFPGSRVETRTSRVVFPDAIGVGCAGR